MAMLRLCCVVTTLQTPLTLILATWCVVWYHGHHVEKVKLIDLVCSLRG